MLLGQTEGEVLCHCFTESQLESVSVFLFVCTDLVPSPVDKTQSRRQSGLVCSLLVVSLLLSAVVGEESELSGSTVRTTMVLHWLCAHVATSSYILHNCMHACYSCVRTAHQVFKYHTQYSLSSFLCILNVLVAFALYTYIMNRTQLYCNYVYIMYIYRSVY